ncbi:MAG: hypothetical protein LBJ36_08885 [Synergistaceae bacterium]|jgi:hypothetical protein|nr:hypothetical protein [Synergistaceae bacterium]
MPDNDNLKKLLEEGEEIRWSGSPQPYGLFDETHKILTLLSLFWAVTWGVILIGGYYAFAVSRALEIKTSVMIFCAAVPLLLAWSPWRDKNSIKKLQYAITDKKVVVFSSEGIKECVLPITNIDAMRIERIERIQQTQRIEKNEKNEKNGKNEKNEKASNGTCHIRFGSSTFKASAKKLLTLATRGEYEIASDTKNYTGLVFYNVSASDGDEICDFLKPYVTIESNVR